MRSQKVRLRRCWMSCEESVTLMLQRMRVGGLTEQALLGLV
ncbi:hypothetical protein HMPREF1868_00382 [Olsenella sp. DNF00959]|nr:hypothetical protein HMPREF1868_00382 [Olsenella sp. DNF00959]